MSSPVYTCKPSTWRGDLRPTCEDFRIQEMQIMRLLTWNDDNELSLTRNLHDDEIPPYATLSHTWARDDEEVSFVDFEDRLSRCQSKAGYEKIQFCGRQARKDGIEHFWVDTCCIDKASSSELSEAITSMYRWYHEAQKCYVYLADVSLTQSNDEEGTQAPWKVCLEKSRWFTRGWTLQELLAPQVVEFYSCEGSFLGTKETLAQQIHQTTTISLAALRGVPLSQFPIAERWCWARKRQTRKKEDQAYCLLGIFDVFMPLIYGEGSNAFYRLEKKIRNRFGADSTACFHQNDRLVPVFDCPSPVGRLRRPDSNADPSLRLSPIISDHEPPPNRMVHAHSPSTDHVVEAVQRSSNGNEQHRSRPNVPADFALPSAHEPPLGLTANVRTRGLRLITIEDHSGRENIRERPLATTSIPSRPEISFAFQCDLSQLSLLDDMYYRVFFLRKQGSDWTQASCTEQAMPVDEIKDRIRHGPRRSRQQKQNIKWMLERMEARRRSTIDHLLQATNRNDAACGRLWKIVAIDDERPKLQKHNKAVEIFSVILANVPATRV